MSAPSRPRFVRCASPKGLHRIAYREWGDPRNDRVLVCAHGLTRCARDFDNLAAVRPGVAVVPVGYRNRFRHPSAEVLERYFSLQIQVLRTDRDGAVTVRLSREGFDAVSERRLRRRYWHDAPP